MFEAGVIVLLMLIFSTVSCKTNAEREALGMSLGITLLLVAAWFVLPVIAALIYVAFKAGIGWLLGVAAVAAIAGFVWWLTRLASRLSQGVSTMPPSGPDKGRLN